MADDPKYTGLSDDEKAAMKERTKELKAEARRNKSKKDGEADLLAKIAEMDGTDRVLAERIHEIVTANAPGLMPKTWYGMPAYTNEAGKVVCYFKAAAKFKMRYAQFGFEDPANLDDGTMWPTVFAVTQLSAAHEQQLAELVKKAAR
ncbi:iron chaperone [Nocardioides speluncae]|uniref:iron chaperone n=1 Tax=Nocardioides speluncae TaxID=2670337 RepID=UPI000D697F71|nr:DUF1801 domain-containing protein [Nocardioides speluncae]